MQFSGMTFTGGFSFYNVGNPDQDPYFNYTTLLLPGNGTNNGTNNTFLDGSTNNFTITRTGNVKQGTFSPYSLTGWSYAGSTSSSYLQVASSAAIQLGTGDFTIECWAYFTTVGTANGGENVVMDFRPTSTQGAYPCFYLSNQTIVVEVASGTRITTGTISLNQWVHIAWVRYNGNSIVYINGTQSGSTYVDNNNYSCGSTNRIGNTSYFSTGDRTFNGYISNFRIVKGTAVYTSAFTPPTSALTAITNTSLLVCKSNQFIDNSSNAFAITVGGTPSIQTFSPFAPAASYSSGTVGGSAYFDGVNDTLSVTAGSGSWADFGTDPFTIEAWIYTPAVAALQGICGTHTGGNNTWQFRLNGATLQLFGGGGGGTAYSGGSVTANTWTHVAACRSGTTVYLFVNGVMTTVAVGAGDTFPASATFNIGNLYSTPSNYWYTGYVSCLRIIKGTALYTSNFTPPTTPPTAITNTALLCNFTNGQITDATSKNDLETVGDAKISTTQSKWGGSSMYFDGTGDSLITDSKLADFGTGNFTVEGWIYVSNSSVPRWIMDSRNVGSDAGFGFFLEDSTGYKLRVYRNGSYLLTSSSNIAINTWYHVVFVRNNSNSFLYIDGTQVASAADTNSYIQSGSFRLGCGWNNQDFYNGFMNGMRVTKGIARYTSNFTPPTAAFPTF